MNQQEIKQLVDDYVSLDEEIKKLERKRDRMKEQIIALGEGAHRATSVPCRSLSVSAVL